MARILDPEAFLKEAASLPVIDVRSPGEFSQGHIPGALNIPLFDDAERAIVGTLYNRSGRETAIQKGIEIATARIPEYLTSLKTVTRDTRILVHCWRGGMRSEHMAALFEQEGYEAGLLTGGYKAYRRHIREALDKAATIIVLGGYTGSGKTGLLRWIEQLGCQVIDLEELACHKGSAFGALGQPPQPTNEQFENELYLRWNRLDKSKPIWLEDESRMIGKVTLPGPLFNKIANGILLRIEVPVSCRVNQLVAEYAVFDKTLLSEAVGKISERLGIPRTREALQAIEDGEFAKVAELVLNYYDKAYDFTIRRRPGKTSYLFRLDSEPNKDTARMLVKCIEEQLHHGTDLS